MTGDPRARRPARPPNDALSGDPYAMLGLPSTAPLGEVKRAYRRLAKAFHPDSAGPEALPRFLAIHAAYERITTGRVLPGTASGATGTPGREPWRADPARARATRRGATGRRSSGQPGTTTGQASNERGGPGSGRRTEAGRRSTTRKATLGSTSYDEARERIDATWSGASWYGPTTGEYWIINPREYADPRKHGPAYQARVRQAAAEAAAEAAATAAAAEATPTEATTAEPSAAGDAAAEVVFDDSTVPEDQPARGVPPVREASRRRATATRPLARPPERHPSTGETRPAGAVDAPQGPPAETAWAPSQLLGGAADDPIRRLRLALIAWPPLGVAAAVAAGDVTGCAVAAAACTGVAPLTPWLAQVVILALLMLLPPVARFLAFGTVAVLLALVPATAVLLAIGAGGAPQAGFALGVLLALAWLAGVAYAAVATARRASLSSAP
ncbi:MAG: J domain-containing protein [Chloroflexi bacterium]|nr:J domain-containing protein [Chloroflexota bacterium]